MQLSFFTNRDDSLDHQVRFYIIKEQVHITCNCRRISGGHYMPMGRSHDLEQSRALYNDPDNHMKPFSEEDEAKW